MFSQVGKAACCLLALWAFVFWVAVARVQAASPDVRWGSIANPGFQQQPILTTLFFTGSAKDGTTPYGYLAPENTQLYTVHPTDDTHLTWSETSAARDWALDQMVDVGINVVTMSSWGEDFLPPESSWGLWAPMQCASQSQDELFAAAVGKSLLITPMIESRPNWAMRDEFPTWGDQVAPGTVSQIKNLVHRYLLNAAHPEWADQWTRVYDRDGEVRYAVALIHASSNQLSPDEHAAYAAGFDAIAQKVFDDTGVKVGFLLDVLPRDSPYAPGIFKPSPEQTGPELAARASILGIQNFIPEIWASVTSDTERINWKREFSEAWAATGIPFLMDACSGYDAHLVFPGSVQYGHNETWTTALTSMVADFGQDGLVYNSWNGYTEGMAAMATVEDGDTYYEWLDTLTGTYAVLGQSVTIQDSAGSLDGDTPNFVAAGDDSTVWNQAIEAALSFGQDVLVSTDNPQATYPGLIQQNADAPIVSAGPGATLTLRSVDDIVLDAPISSTAGPLALVLMANDPAQSAHDADPAAGDVDINAPITTAGGDFSSSGVNFDNTGGAIITAAGDATLNHTGNTTIGAALAAATLDITSGGPLQITTTGSLRGSGSINGDVQNDGLMAPGNSPGTIDLTGSYTQSPSGTLEIELASPDSDRLNVTGDVSLSGTLSVQATSRLDTIKDQTLRIITAAGPAGVTGTFSTAPTPYVNVPNEGDYLGYGVWFGNFGGIGVTYVGAPGVVTAVDIPVFQAQQGDATGDRHIDFSDFSKLSFYWTGPAGPPPGETREWRQGDFTSDNKVDFSDFTKMSFYWTGPGAEYGTPPGEKALGEDQDPPQIGLRVYLIDADDPDVGRVTAGTCVMVGDPYLLSGYSVYSPSGSLLPDADWNALPYGLYFANDAQEVTAGNIPLPYAFPGALKFDWGFNVSLKEQDLEFLYGGPWSADAASGAVVYIVPEPSTLILLAFGSLGLLLLAIRRRRYRA